MKDKSISWIFSLENDLHPSQVNVNGIDNSYFHRTIANLRKNCKVFRPEFIRIYCRSKQQSITLLRQLIHASDTVSKYLLGMAPSWNEGRFSSRKRQLYIQTLSSLQVLVDSSISMDRERFYALPITVYAQSDIRILLRYKLETLRENLANSGLKQNLIELIVTGIQLLIRRKKITGENVEYAFTIMKALSILDSPSNVEVENLLYQYDFNTPAFFNYCTKCCNESLADTPGQHIQMEIIISWEDRIIGLPTRTSLRWMKRDESIQIQLKSFLKEKKLYLQQRINLRRAELHDFCKSSAKSGHVILKS